MQMVDLSRGWLSVVSLGCAVMVGGVKVHAQVMPNDNDAWRGRCDQYLDAGSVPAPDLSGITAARYEELARDRSSRNQHFVACNLYLSGSAAESAMGPTQASMNDVTLAKLERKMALGQKLSFGDKLTRASAAVIVASKPAAPPNALEANAVNMLVIPGDGMIPGGMGMQPMQQGMGMQQPMQAQQGGGMTLGMSADPTQGQGMAMQQGAGMGTSSAVSSGAASNRRWGGSRRSNASYSGGGGTSSSNAAAAGTGRGASGLPPIGRYTCYAGGMSVLANGMGYNPMTIHVAGFNGYLSILDRTHYAGTDGKDMGTYVMNGNDVVPQSGPYKRVPAALHYVADGQYHRPTMFVQWLDDNGKPMGAGSMICTWDGLPK